MRMDPEGIGGSACAKQNVLKVRANRASVIRQARGERSEIFIAGLQKELSARGRRVTLRAQKNHPMWQREECVGRWGRKASGGRFAGPAGGLWPPLFAAANAVCLSPRAKRHQRGWDCQPC